MAGTWFTWPGLGQGWRLVHQRQRQRRWHTQGHAKLTSLPPARAGPAEWLGWSRRHGAIETELHAVRDVTLGEDLSRIRSGAAPQALAAVRHLVVAVLQHHGFRNRAAGLRHLAWQQDQAAAALGLLGAQPRTTARGRRQRREVDRALPPPHAAAQVGLRPIDLRAVPDPLPFDPAAAARPLGQSW